MPFEQVKIDDKGTFGGFDPSTNQAVAFPTMEAFNQYFPGQTPNPNAQLANFDVSSLLGVNAGQVKPVTVNSLNPEQTIQVPTPPPQADNLAPATAGAESTSKSIEQQIKDFLPDTQTRTEFDALSKQVSDLLPELGGRGQAQLEAEQQAGLPEQRRKLAEVNAQIQMAVAEANKATATYQQLIANLENPNNLQQRGVTLDIVSRQQGAVRRSQQADATLRAANLNVLQAYALGLQGQVQAAQNMVDRSVDLRYQDREAEVNIKMQQLQLLEGKLNKEEQAVAEIRRREYEQEQQRIKDEKESAKRNLSLAVEQGVSSRFANNNGEVFDTKSGVGYKDEATFQQATGITVAEAYARGMITDINYDLIQQRGAVQNLINTYSDAGITTNDTLEEAQAKIPNSRIYRDQIRGPQGTDQLSSILKGLQIEDLLGGTSTQRSVAGYAQRIEQANQIFDRLEDSILSLGKGLGVQRKLPSILKKDEVRQLEQAERNFVNAVLRRESGAAISDTEFDSAALQYFPQAGDDAGTLAQKKINRQTTLNNFINESGRAYNPAPAYVPGTLIEDDGVTYKVEADGVTVTPQLVGPQKP